MNRVYATLSADIVDSTSLSAEDTVKLKESLEGFFPVMQLFCDKAWGRVTRGDSVECVEEGNKGCDWSWLTENK